MAFLDAPFVMDALALCGRDRETNAKQIIEGLTTMSCRVRVLSHSCDEIRDNLQGVLRRSPGQRFGPTADAMRRSELNLEYAQAVCANPDHFIQNEIGLEVLRWNMDLYPNEHVYFPSKDYEDLLGTLHFHTNISARERDAQSIAVIMRRRSGSQSRDVFKTKFFLITRNHLLAHCAREFCVQRGHLREHEEGPVVTQRRLAALLWLTLGAQDRQELTRRQLLVACERVSQIRPELIDGAMKKLKKVQEADLPKLEALLTQPRSTQMLMDLTLNRQEVVTEENIEEILDMMRKATAEELELEKKKEIRDIRRSAQGEVAEQKEHRVRAEKSLASKKEELAGVRSLLQQNEQRDMDMLQNWADDAAGFQSRALRLEKALLLLLALGLVIAGWLLDTDAMPQYAGFIAWVLAALTFFFAIASINPRLPNVLRPWISRTRDKRFGEKIKKAGRADLLERYEVDWESVIVRKR